MSLIESLRASGKLDSRGEFTLDSDKAADKLGRFQLSDSSRFLLEIVASAHQLAVESLNLFRSEAVGLQLVFEGLELKPGMPTSLHEHLLDPSSPYQRLAVAINALDSNQVRHRWTDSEGQVWDSKLGARGKPLRDLVCLELSSEHSSLFDDALQLLQNPNTVASRFPIQVNAKTLTHPSIDGPWGKASSVEPPVCQLALQSQSKAIMLVKHGLIYQDDGPELLDSFPFTALCWADNLPLDAAFARVVQGPELLKCQQAIESAFWNHLGQILERGQPDQILNDLLSQRILAEHIRRCPALGRLEFLPSSDGQRYSIDQLLLWETIELVTDFKIQIPPGQVALRVTNAQVNLLRTLYPEKCVDVTHKLLVEEQSNRARQDYLSRKTEPVKLQGNLSEHTVHRIQSQDGGSSKVHWSEYELSIDGEGLESNVRVLFQERFLLHVTPKGHFPYRAVINFEQLPVNPDFDDVYDRSVFKPIFEELEAIASQLYQEWMEKSPAPAYFDRLRSILKERSSAAQFSIYHNSPLYPAVWRNLQTSVSVDKSRIWTRVSLHQIKEAHKDGRSIGILSDPRLVPDLVPAGAWRCDLILFIDSTERQLVAKYLGIKVSKIGSQEAAFKELSTRFSSPERPSYPDPFAESYQRLAKKEEGRELHLVLGPDSNNTQGAKSTYRWGNLSLRILCHGVEVDQILLSVRGPGASAEIEQAGLPIGPGWKGVVDGREFENCRYFVLSCYQEALKNLQTYFTAHPVGPDHHWMGTLRKMMEFHLSGAEEFPVWQTHLGPLSLRQLSQYQDKKLATVSSRAKPEVVDELLRTQQVDLLITDPEASRLRTQFLPKLQWVSLDNEESRLQALSDFRARPSKFPESIPDKIAQSHYRQGPWDVWVTLVPRNDSVITYFFEKIAVHSASGPLSHLMFQIQHQDFVLSSDAKSVVPGPWRTELTTVTNAAMGALLREHRSKATGAMILRWLEDFRTPAFRAAAPTTPWLELLYDIEVFPLLDGSVSLEELRQSANSGQVLYLSHHDRLPGKFEGNNFIFDSPQEQFDGLTRLEWPASERPVILAMSPELEPLRSTLQSHLGQPLVSAAKVFEKLLMTRVCRARFEKRLAQPPRCWILHKSVNDRDQDYLGIPIHPQDQGLLCCCGEDGDQIEEYSPHFPLCGVLHSPRQKAIPAIGQLYLDFFRSQRSLWQVAQRVDVDHLSRYWNLPLFELEARLAFCTEQREELLRQAKKSADERDREVWSVQLLEFPWIPAENSTKVSLDQIRQFRRPCYVESDLRLDQLQAIQEFGERPNPWLVLGHEPLRRFLGGWCGRSLELMVYQPTSSWQAVSHSFSRSLQASSEMTQRLTQAVGGLFMRAMAPSDSKKAPKKSVQSAATKSVVTKSDTQLLLTALKRESARCLSGRTREIVDGELELMTTSKHLWGPAISFESKTRRLHLNVSHQKIRQVLTNLDDSRQTITLLLAIVGHINIQREELTDRQEELALDGLLEKMCHSFAQTKQPRP